MTSLWLPCTQMQHLDQSPPLHIVRGQGAYLFDATGKSYIDTISSWWVNLHGHCHPYINKKIKQQLDTLEHTLLASVVHPSIELLAEKLVQIFPKSKQKPLTKAFFADSGSAAIECALKMSLQSWHQNGFTEKNTFVSLEHGYHGETLGSLAVTDIPIFSKQYAPLLIQHLRVSSPADIFCQKNKTQAEHEAESLAKLETLFSEKHEKICAFILEPLVQGACGMGMYSASYLTQTKKLCEKYNIHLIADEIAVGFGRTGTMFACEQAKITPDFICLSKGLTAGYLPMSCVLTTDEVYDAFLDDRLERGFLHSHSYTGNPLAAQAALASLELFEQNHVLENNQLLIDHITSRLKALESHPVIKNCRQTGMIAAFTIKSDTMMNRHIHQYALTQGVFLRPIGNHVYIMPPYCITTGEIDKLFDVLVNAVDFAIHQKIKKTDNAYINEPNSQSSIQNQIDPKLLA